MWWPRHWQLSCWRDYGWHSDDCSIDGPGSDSSDDGTDWLWVSFLPLVSASTSSTAGVGAIGTSGVLGRLLTCLEIAACTSGLADSLLFEPSWVPISRSTGVLTTVLPCNTWCNCVNNVKSASVPSSTDSMPVPLHLCLSITSLYFFCSAFSLSQHCFMLCWKPCVTSPFGDSEKK